MAASGGVPDAGAPEILSSDETERLRALGYVVVPLKPTDDMRKVGAPICYQAYDGDWAIACEEAGDCYRAMIECGAL